MNPSDAKIEAIKGVVEELLTSSGSGDPKTYAFNAIAQISAIFDMEPMNVLDLLEEQQERRIDRQERETLARYDEET